MPHSNVPISGTAPNTSDDLSVYLAALFGGLDAGLIELRWRVPTGMRSAFVAVTHRERVREVILERSAATDVYLGVAPRVRDRGTRADVERVHAVWADCDTPEAISALEAFSPSPSMVVHTGRGLHAYWLLGAHGADAATVEAVNRRLAHALGSDTSVTDASRILRPPLSVSHKYDQPRPVTMRSFTGEQFTVEEIAAALPELPAPRRPRRTVPAVVHEDVLKTISAPTYVKVLTGQEVGRDGKIASPFHEDGTPSLHVYDGHWVCYGCARGGTIIDLGSYLYGIEPRGRGYHEIRRRLATDLLHRRVAA
jgi:hypothetical protein